MKQVTVIMTKSLNHSFSLYLFKNADSFSHCLHLKAEKSFRLRQDTEEGRQQDTSTFSNVDVILVGI